MQFISVVLPAPLTPMMPSVSPAAALRSTPSSATKPPKRLVSARVSIATLTAGSSYRESQTA